MLLRLLTLVSLLFLSQGLLAQQSGTARPNSIPATCPVTTPYQTSLFVPPSPYPPKAPAGNFWFGSDGLWTRLPVSGRWELLPDYTPTAPTFRQKLFFYREGYFPRTEPRPRLTVTGRRLDSSAPPVLSDRTTTGLHGDQQSMVVGVDLPTLGCWEITGRYEGDELTFVVWVSGDTAVVSKAGIVYVVGDVHSPTRVVMEHIGPMTVLEALVIAEGANPTANLHNAKIIRKGENGPTEVPVDINKILQAKAPDVTLQADDILFVPHSASRSTGKLQKDYFYDVPPSGPLQSPTRIYIR